MRATPLTVAELVAILSALPAEQQAMPVQLEGCDCLGPASGEVKACTYPEHFGIILLRDQEWK